MAAWRWQHKSGVKMVRVCGVMGCKASAALVVPGAVCRSLSTVNPFQGAKAPQTHDIAEQT
eukprot:scaffold60084_cov23-Tisochrysis_lutea.AAC.1